MLIHYRIEIRDNDDGLWRDHSHICLKIKTVLTSVRRPFIFWRWKAVKTVVNIVSAERAARRRAIWRARRLFEVHGGNDIRVYEVSELFTSKIWENGKFTDT